jgi:uncharacterized membrane protein
MKGTIMNHSFHIRGRIGTAVFVAVAAAGFGGVATPSAAAVAGAGQAILQLTGVTADQQCPAPLEREWRDWRRPRGVNIPR